MQILKLDPRALKDNPDDTCRSKASSQSAALLLATVKAVGIIQPCADRRRHADGIADEAAFRARVLETAEHVGELALLNRPQTRMACSTPRDTPSSRSGAETDCGPS